MRGFKQLTLQARPWRRSHCGLLSHVRLASHAALTLQQAFAPPENPNTTVKPVVSTEFIRRFTMTNTTFISRPVLDPNTFEKIGETYYPPGTMHQVVEQVMEVEEVEEGEEMEDVQGEVHLSSPIAAAPMSEGELELLPTELQEAISVWEGTRIIPVLGSVDGETEQQGEEEEEVTPAATTSPALDAGTAVSPDKMSITDSNTSTLIPISAADHLTIVEAAHLAAEQICRALSHPAPNQVQVEFQRIYDDLLARRRLLSSSSVSSASIREPAASAPTSEDAEQDDPDQEAASSEEPTESATAMAVEPEEPSIKTFPIAELSMTAFNLYWNEVIIAPDSHCVLGLPRPPQHPTHLPYDDTIDVPSFRPTDPKKPRMLFPTMEKQFVDGRINHLIVEGKAFPKPVRTLDGAVTGSLKAIVLKTTETKKDAEEVEGEQPASARATSAKKRKHKRYVPKVGETIE